MAPSASPTQRAKEEMERHHNYAEICRGRTYIRINGTEKQAHLDLGAMYSKAITEECSEYDSNRG